MTGLSNVTKKDGGVDKKELIQGLSNVPYLSDKDKHKAETPLLPQRNNSDPPPNWKTYDTAMRELRPYVQKCGTGTMATLWHSQKVTMSALLCKSWNCPTCRKQKAAQLLDRLNKGVISEENNNIFITLTLDPSKYGAKFLGNRYWNGDIEVTKDQTYTRKSTIWTEPTKKQFKQAVKDMSHEWNALNDRLRRKAQRAKVATHEYFRVVELHRNGWPHYHVLIRHPFWNASAIKQQLSGWNLGRTDARDISHADAIAEIAPYLISKEKKQHKAYQFAASALPKNFRLYSCSKNFLAPLEPASEQPEHAQILSGHFTTHHESLKTWGADSRIALRPIQPDEQPHKPPSSSIAIGDEARLYYLAYLENNETVIKPEFHHLLVE